MTVDSEPLNSTQFLYPVSPTFYQAKVTFKHWQLRSLLCSPSPGLLYYPSNNRIYSLDTETRKRRLIATLPFSPRCIGARHGWICAGGLQDGHFATIRVGETEGAEDEEDRERYAFDMELEEYFQDQWMYGPRKVHIKKLGGLIVNSVTLHRPPSASSDDDVLAVLTNNDKTVRIFHLGQTRVVSTLHVDVPTNHASISPDGLHLVVVGDAPTVYFYHPAGNSSSDGGAGIGDAGCGSWVLSSHPPLQAGSKNDALMSTSFSPSSLHCAVASQAGVITVFDTRYLDSEDAVVRVITSSRASTGPGAIRTVQFSPAPWDLLVWAEHCGRVCVADARNNFATRQIMDVSTTNEDVTEVEIEDVQDMPSAWDISQRVLGNRSAYGAEEDSTDRFGMINEEMGRPRSMEELQELLMENTHEWLAYTSRLRNMPPQNMYHSTDPLAELMRQPSRITAPLTPLSGVQPTLLRNYRERQIERERARQRYHDPPRRRNSIHPSYGSQNDHPTTSSSSTTLGEWGGGGEQASSSRGIGSREPRSAPLEQLALASIVAEQQRQRRGGRFDADISRFSATSASDGTDISGCTLSPDGRKLFVATPKGILEYQVNVAMRKVFPAITPR